MSQRPPTPAIAPAAWLQSWNTGAENIFICFFYGISQKIVQLKVIHTRSLVSLLICIIKEILYHIQHFEDVSLVFTRMPGESYCSRLGSCVCVCVWVWVWVWVFV